MINKELLFSYVTNGFVEYEPPVNHDAYDENEDAEYFV